jgi:hypothetical protein
LSVSYYLSIRKAQQVITELGADPDVVHFLRAGSARTDRPRLRYACDQLAEVFNISLMNVPTLALLLCVARPEAKTTTPARVHDEATSQFYKEPHVETRTAEAE